MDEGTEYINPPHCKRTCTTAWEDAQKEEDIQVRPAPSPMQGYKPDLESTATKSMVKNSKTKAPAPFQMQGYEPTPDLENTATKSMVKNDKTKAPVYLWTNCVQYVLDLLELESSHLQPFDLLR
ncbi:hypothetical protein ACA910_005650 [Epithemia clementina (nom. ined.)]